MHFPWRAVAAGLGTGLADDAAVLPAAAARCAHGQAHAGVAQAGGARPGQRSASGLRGGGRAGCNWALPRLVIVALGAIAWALSDSVKVGGWFALLFSIALLVLLILAAVALRVLRFVLNRVRLHLPSSLRHGLANLYRPGNQSAAVLASLGTGVMLILAVYLMQSTLLREIRETASPKLPNVFLIDITTDEVAGVRAFFQHQPGVTQPLDLLPGVQGRFVSLMARRWTRLKDQHFPRRMLETAELSWADTPPAGDKVTQGKWWTDAKRREIAIGEGTAQRLHLGVGSTVEIADRRSACTHLKVAALYQADGQHLGGACRVHAPFRPAQGRAGDVVRRRAHRPEAGCQRWSERFLPLIQR